MGFKHIKPKDIKQIELPKIEDYCVPVYHLFVIKTEKRDARKADINPNTIPFKY